MKAIDYVFGKKIRKQKLRKDEYVDEIGIIRRDLNKIEKVEEQEYIEQKRAHLNPKIACSDCKHRMMFSQKNKWQNIMSNCPMCRNY